VVVGYENALHVLMSLQYAALARRCSAGWYVGKNDSR
jgi:hypothetical protein